MREINSDKDEFQISNSLYGMLNNEEAVEYLITYRKQIKEYLAAIDFF